MFTFTRAIVRTPGRSMVAGLAKAGLGLPDYDRARRQHDSYVTALENCGLQVEVLEADEAYPDSTFVEDVAVLTPHCAVITRPAAPSRTGEITGMRSILPRFYQEIEEIADPGTLDGGDVMQIGQHCYIGLSARTNREGAEQLITILNHYGMTGSMIPVTEFLHLKSGVTCVTERNLVTAGEFVTCPEFSEFTRIEVPAAETGAANCLRINDRILMPAGFPKVRDILAARGEYLIEIDISEFAKIDGGLTCLSLRVPG